MNKIRAARKASNRWAWFATENGRKFSLGCVVTFGCSTAAFNLLPHTLLLDEYREFYQIYKKSTPLRVSSKIKKQFTAVLDDLNLPNEIRACLKPFMVTGFDVFHAGTTQTRSGALVGIPTNFNYETIDDIDKSALLVQGRHVDFDNPEAHNLLSAITLSEDAKKFAIAREIARCQTLEPILNAVYPLSCTATAYLIAHKANNLLEGFYRPLSVRLFLYMLAGFFAWGNWILMKDITTVHYDAESDIEAGKLGKDYVKGGKEFYEKILQRNVALRNLMGKEGVKLYSASGNEEFYFRHKRMPVIHRKLYFDGEMDRINGEIVE